jgi:3-deoxy-manno-octulosonate cytidylyltransferase (CMP-KDO synthetase)
MPHCTIVIPARAGSTRFANKPLATLCGRTLIERVWRIASAVKGAHRVVVATDSQAIAEHVQCFGGTAIYTEQAFRNGSERAAYVAAKLTPISDIIVNLQGDAVLTPPWAIEAVIEALVREPHVPIATPAVALSGLAYDAYLKRKATGRASGTLVVFDVKGSALYFSKGIIPHLRAPPADKLLAKGHQHIGLYAYRADALAQYAALPPGPLEQVEQLEQLRALEHGMQIRVVPVDLRGRTQWSVDYPEDIEIAETIITWEGELV